MQVKGRRQTKQRRLRVTGILTPISLYVVAAALLLFHIGDHPPFPYNWEGYTAWGLFTFLDHPSDNILRLNQGLMTDSSHSVLTILPAWLGYVLGGIGLASMRVPIALIAAGAAPLLWLVGRRLFGQRVALLAAILLALSPVYLLYGRTATVVGLSLVPALLTIYALVRVLQRPGSRGWFIVLQVMLVLGAYAYAPIRFLWPLSLMLLLIEWVWRWEERRTLGIALAVTALTLPTFLFFAGYSPGNDPLYTLAEYYAGRGEQIGNLSANPGEYTYYLELTPDEQAEGGKPKGDTFALAWRLFTQNARSYAGLLLDWDTRPALSDYWNPRGRLYPLLLVSFFLVGLGYAAWRGRKRVGLEYRVLLILFFGFGLPLLLTSRVHIGRLIFALPLLMLIVAVGYYWALDRVTRLVIRWRARRDGVASALPVWMRAVSSALTLSLVVAVGWLTWLDYSTLLLPGRESATVAALKSVLAEARASGGVAFVVKPESEPVLEEINIVPYRLYLDADYRFTILPAGESQPPTLPSGDARPLLYLGGVIARLEKPTTMPNYCANLYYVDPLLEPEFLATMRKRGSLCREELKYRLLP